MRKLWKSVRPSSRPATLAMRPCCSTRSGPVRTPNRGGPTPPGPPLATISCGHRSVWVEPSGGEAPPEPRRNHDALRQAAWAAPVRAWLRPSLCRVPSPCRRPQWVHCPQYIHHRRPQDRSVLGKGTSDRHQFNATESCGAKNLQGKLALGQRCVDWILQGLKMGIRTESVPCQLQTELVDNKNTT